MDRNNTVFTTFVKLSELIFGVISLSIGVTLGIISGLGQTTSTATSSSIAGAFGIKVGTAMFVLYALFLLGQIALLRKNFQKIRLLQLVPIILQMFTLNYFKYDFAPLQALHPDTYFSRFMVLAAGILLISLGFTIIKYSYFLNYPPEAFMGIIAEKLNVKFGYVKIGGDVFYVIAAVVICLLSGNKIDMVREGTLIFALVNGLLINFYTPYVLKAISFYERLIFRGYNVRLLLTGIYQYKKA